MGFSYWLLSLLFSLFDMHPKLVASHFLYTCLALDVDVCFASSFLNKYLLFFLFFFICLFIYFGSLGFCLRILYKVIIRWMEIYLFFFSPSYAALFLCRDSGCKNSLMSLFFFMFLSAHKPCSHCESSCGALWWCEGGRAPNWLSHLVRIWYKFAFFSITLKLLF